MIDVPIFNKNHLSLYQIIKEPGTYIVSVANTVKPQYLIEDGSKSRYIVNLRVATISGFETCLKALGKKETCNFDEVRKCFICGTIWERELQDITNLPTKGENVIATFDYVDDILRCVSLTLIPRKTLENFDLSAYNEIKNMYKDLLKTL